MMTRLLAISMLFGAPFMTAVMPGQAAVAQEPAETLSLRDFHIRDPWILSYEPTHTYYLYASTSDTHRAGVMVYRSKDLKKWEKPRPVFSLPDGTWADPQQPAWAPEVHSYNGKFYLFVTLHNPKKIIAAPPAVWRTNIMRGTAIAVSDSPDGPFTLVKTDAPTTPADFMSLDGTLYMDAKGKAWIVYAHEWKQKIDGTIEGQPLKEDLTGSAGAPVFLFKGSDAQWLDRWMRADRHENSYVTDGPELFRTKDGHLLMLWSSFGPKGYVEALARSRSGEIQGPWEQLPSLLDENAGHGMLFHRFDGGLMLIVHKTNSDPYAALYDVADHGDRLDVVRERFDLDKSK